MTNPDKEQVLVIGPDGRPVAMPAAEAEAATSGTTEGAESEAESVAEMVEQPAKVMRIGTMIKQLLEEVRAAPLDDASRKRLKDIHTSSIRELEQGLAPELREELERLSLPFTDDSIPSDAELRIAFASLLIAIRALARVRARHATHPLLTHCLPALRRDIAFLAAHLH